MRIITGTLKGKKLYTPNTEKIRPTSDLVKESMFNILIPYLDEDSIVVDVFAGTGNLGIEALSRGVKRAYFFDQSRDSIKLIKKNIAHCGLEESAKVYTGNSIDLIGKMKEQADFFLIDPPYKEGLAIPCIEKILETDKLREEGMIVVEHSKDETMPEQIGNLTKEKERRYGTIMLTVYSPNGKETNEL